MNLNKRSRDRKKAGFFVSNIPLNLPPDFACREVSGIRIYYASVDRYGDPVTLAENGNAVLVMVGKLFGLTADDLLAQLCSDLRGVERTLQRVNGEFGLVLIRKDDGRLTAACDKIGHQELYAKSWKQGFALFPDLALLQHLKPNRFSQLGVSLLLKFRYPLPPATFFEDVFLLPGGCVWEISPSRVEVRHQRYWNVQAKYSLKDEKEFAPLLADKIIESCRYRSATGPNSLFLSGGLDSACVLYGLLKADRQVHAGFIGFQGYVVQERFADIVSRLASEAHVPCDRMDYDWASPDAWENVLEGIEDVYSTYSTQAAFIRYLKQAKAPDHNRVFFWGESADGLFGLNLTFEDDVDPYLRINRNMVRTAKFYAGHLAGNGFGTWAARAVKEVAGLVWRMDRSQKIASRFAFLTSVFDKHLDFEDYMLGYYYHPSVLPGFSRHYCEHPLLTRAAFEGQIDFFRKEYLEPARQHYECGGVGAAAKALIFRLENMSIDIRMKRATGVVGWRPVFPLYDADVCEVVYSIPNKFFVFRSDQRPKYPLRATAQQCLGVPAWLLSERKATNYPNRIDPEVAAWKAIEGPFWEYISNRTFLSHMDKHWFQMPRLECPQIERFRDAIPFLVLEHLARDYC